MENWCWDWNHLCGFSTHKPSLLSYFWCDSASVVSLASWAPKKDSRVLATVKCCTKIHDYQFALIEVNHNRWSVYAPQLELGIHSFEIGNLVSGLHLWMCSSLEISYSCYSYWFISVCQTHKLIVSRLSSMVSVNIWKDTVVYDELCINERQKKDHCYTNQVWCGSVTQYSLDMLQERVTEMFWTSRLNWSIMASRFQQERLVKSLTSKCCVHWILGYRCNLVDKTMVQQKTKATRQAEPRQQLYRWIRSWNNTGCWCTCYVKKEYWHKGRSCQWCYRNSNCNIEQQDHGEVSHWKIQRFQKTSCVYWRQFSLSTAYAVTIHKCHFCHWIVP